MADNNLSPSARAILDHLSAAYSSAYVALMYVTDPAHWPGFAAFAEQRAAAEGCPGEWTEADRVAMRGDAKIISAIAHDMDKRGGFIP